MIKAFFFCISVVFWNFSAQAGQSDDGFYTRTDIGGVYSTQTPLKKGFDIQMGFGQRWAEIFRGEMTFEYTRVVMKGPGAYNRTADFVRTRLPSWTVMTAGYIDLFDYKNVSPYIGAGIGVSRNDTPDAVVDGGQVFGDSRFRFAWKAGGGIGIRLPKNLVLDIGYAYTDLGTFSVKDISQPAVKQDVKIRRVNIGLRYNF
ncbi:MAG: porin family protein [Alphaproteobacteria bacterium]|nr:porin family protein [Alphaproteobacteria bacterium]